MAAKVPVKANFTGSDVTSLGEFASGDTIDEAYIASLTASKLTGALPAISGANLTNLPAAASKLSLSGGTMSGNIVMGSNLVDGIDISARDGILTSTTTTANAAMPKAGGAFTGNITTNGLIDTRDVAADGVLATNALPKGGGTMTGDLILGDGIKLEVGAASGGDLQIYHDGSNSYIDDAGTGNLKLRSSGTAIQFETIAGENMVVGNVDGSVDLYHNDVKKFETTANGVTIINARLETQTANNSSTHLVQRMGSTAGSYGYVDFELENPVSTAATYPRFNMEVGNAKVLQLIRGGSVRAGPNNSNLGKAMLSTWQNNTEAGTSIGGTNLAIAMQHYGGANTVVQLGMGYCVNHPPAVIGYKVETNSGNTKGDIFFATRDDTADIAPTERLRITVDGRGLSQFTAKFWALVRSAPSTPVFRDSHNCSSITDHAVGDITVNLTVDMGQADYAVVASGGSATSNPSDKSVATVPVDAGAVRLEIYNMGGTHHDLEYISVIGFGD